MTSDTQLRRSLSRILSSRLSFGILALLTILIGLYPGIYLLQDQRFGYLNSKPDALYNSPLWNLGFYTHIIFGGVAMLVGWTQFSTRLRTKYLSVHRWVGRVYVAAVVPSALAGIGIGFFANGGLVSTLGFVSLGLIWFYTTVQAYRYIRQRNTERHRVMMIYSYAACFAAVTLRLWLPGLIMLFKDFEMAYRVVAWLCWVPNLAVAHFFLVKQN